MISLDYILVLGCIFFRGYILSLGRHLWCHTFCYTGTRFLEQVRRGEVLLNHSALGGFHAGPLFPLPIGDFWLLGGLCVGVQRLAF